MTVRSRQQFVDYWNNINPGLGDPDSGLWAYERDIGPLCQWFLFIKPIKVSISTKQIFWDWCKQYCPSGVSCYSASDEEETWGFVSKQEMTWFILRWS
jgi:hypothetical protein